MKIVENTASTLKLKAQFQTLGTFGVLFGLPFLVGGIIAALTIGQRSLLTCDRLEPKQVECELKTNSFLAERTMRIPVGHLQGAEVEVNDGDDGDTYRVALITQGGRVPLTEVYSAGIGFNHRGKVEQINAFLQNPEQMTLTVQEDYRWFAYLFGGIFVIVGGVIVFASLTAPFPVDCTFDKRSGQAKLRQRSLIATHVQEYRLHEVKEARLVESTDSDGDTVYRAQLVLRSGKEISIDFLGAVADKQNIVDVINTFLNPRR
ncbi:MAG TPA: hypothetical protein IGS53_25555 [Leptolyngbyaceae cyanobacterium M33_DOE_097]|uniref:Uncharacterized protein n=1 Tax=Oscillatoriales cyanobacterium SpSt-418 TaxID=2282169 RepID=A0A7C3KFN0_9CYAN|nr:hypothetical protein [Leptolyngbyaceae cyanobacterium M33_DOE_097]